MEYYRHISNTIFLFHIESPTAIKEAVNVLTFIFAHGRNMLLSHVNHVYMYKCMPIEAAARPPDYQGRCHPEAQFFSIGENTV